MKNQSPQLSTLPVCTLPVCASPHLDRALFSPASCFPDPSILLNGFSLFIHFLLVAESDYHCNAPLHAHTRARRNYRLGCHARTLRTPLGTIPILVPNLRFPPQYPFVPIVKRAKRVSLLILDSLSRILTAGVNPDDASMLIKTLWTMELSDNLLASLTADLIPILEQWRARFEGHESVATSNRTSLRFQTADF